MLVWAPGSAEPLGFRVFVDESCAPETVEDDCGPWFVATDVGPSPVVRGVEVDVGLEVVTPGLSEVTCAVVTGGGGGGARVVVGVGVGVAVGEIWLLQWVNVLLLFAAWSRSAFSLVHTLSH